jgi:hypothetical protein
MDNILFRPGFILAIKETGFQWIASSSLHDYSLHTAGIKERL